MYTSTKGFAPSLHTLRGLAALSVVFFHAAQMPPTKDPGIFSFVLQFGAGVTLFFLLSGFSLALSTHDRVGQTDWVRAYTIRRLARILPVWYLFVAFHVIYQYLKYGKVTPVSEIILNVIPVFGLVPGLHTSFVWAGWTVGVEVLFYIAFPVLLAGLGSRALWWAVASVICIVVSLAFVNAVPPDMPPSYSYMSFVHQLFVFVVGAWLFFLAQAAVARRSTALFVRTAAVVSLAGFIWWAAAVMGFPWAVLGANVLLVKTCALGGLVAIAYLRWPLLGAKSRSLRFLGDHSYTIYLSHPVVVAETNRFYPGIYGAVGSTGLAFLLYSLLVVAFTCMVAWAITRLLEAPVYRWGSALARRLETAQRGAVQMGR